METNDRRKRTKKLQITCDCGCGTAFLRYRNKVSPTQNFLNPKHQGLYNSEVYQREHCGPFYFLFAEYLQGAAKLRYRSTAHVRAQICPFLLFLQEEGFRSLTDVGADTITNFIAWTVDSCYKSAGMDLSTLSTFFHWCRVVGHYERENPVIPSKHTRKKKMPRKGRPYSSAEIDQIRALLSERGTERARAIFEIAYESGLRNGEICRLRIKDVDLESKRFLVCLPNKGMRERAAFVFSERTVQRINEWLAVRRTDCTHDVLFHGRTGSPSSVDRVTQEFNRILRKNYAGRPAHEVGLDSFSLHRLRHTATSRLASGGAEHNTLMECMGWVSPQSPTIYLALDEGTTQSGYLAAVKIIGTFSHSESKVISDDELLAEAA